jgi:hypothetical protein
MISQTPSGSVSSGSDSRLLPDSGSPRDVWSSWMIASPGLNNAVCCSTSWFMRRRGTVSHGRFIRGLSRGRGGRPRESSSTGPSWRICRLGGQTAQTVGVGSFASPRASSGTISIIALTLANVIHVERQGHRPSSMRPNLREATERISPGSLPIGELERGLIMLDLPRRSLTFHGHLPGRTADSKHIPMVSSRVINLRLEKNRISICRSSALKRQQSTLHRNRRLLKISTAGCRVRPHCGGNSVLRWLAFRRLSRRGTCAALSLDRGGCLFGRN